MSDVTVGHDSQDDLDKEYEELQDLIDECEFDISEVQDPHDAQEKIEKSIEDAFDDAMKGIV